MACLDKIATYLFYILMVDFSLEALDQIHRYYASEESFEIISMMMSGQLYLTLFTMQIVVGTFIPLAILGIFQFYKPIQPIRILTYFMLSILVQIGIFFMRWNVVIGGQLFSKSFYGFTSFKLGLIGPDSLLMTVVWIILPFIILAFLLWFLPPWQKMEEKAT
jgi:hypothetical protein